MSKIAVSPNGSGTGTYTLASPNNNASHTITLPVATGELLVNTSTGVSVTGTVTADGLTVDGLVKSDTASNGFRVLKGSSAYYGELSVDYVSNDVLTYVDSIAGASYNGSVKIRTANNGGSVTDRVSISSSGVSFYDSTGTTPKFFWDASAEALGVGTAAPDSYYAKKLVVDCGTDGQNGITIKSSTTGAGMFAFADGTSGSDRYRGYINYNHADDSMTLGTAGGSGTVSVSSTGVISGDGSGLTGVVGSTTAGAVGTYVFARGALRTSSRQFVWNSTYSGSGLYPAGPSAFVGATGSGSTWNTSGYGMAAGYYLASALTGTWRCLGHTHPTYDNPVTLFVRIS